MLRTGQKRKASDLDLSLSTRPPKSPRKLSTSLGSRTAVSFLPTPLQGLFNRFFAPQMTIVDESGPALPPKQVSPWAAAPTTSARSIYPTPSPTNSSSDAGPSRPPPPPPPASRQHIWGTSAFDAQRRAIPSMNDAEAWPTLGGTAKLSQPKSTTSLRTVPSTSAAWQKKEPMFQRKEARRIADQDEEDRMRLQLQWLDATQAGKTTSSFEDYRGLMEYRKQVNRASKQFQASPLVSLSLDSSGVDDYVQAQQDERMDRAIRTAKASRNAPYPAKVAIPSLERLTLGAAALDKELDRRAQPRRRFPASLGTEREAKVREAMRKEGVISTMPGAEVTARDIRKLGPGQWLNDEVINFYAVLLNVRSKAYQAELEKMPESDRPPLAKRKFLRVHAFTSFFFAKLKTAGYDGVRRWTKKVDLFACDVVIVPINMHNAHWVCACINVRQKRFEFYDSMGANNAYVLGLLRDYLQAEHKDKKKKELDLDDWVDFEHPDIPQQENGFDCGVFVSQVAECLSRPNAALDYSQSNMPYLRKKMVYEIATQTFLEEEEYDE